MSEPEERTGALARLYRPPLIGLLAFVTVMLANPLTHSLSVLTARLVGREHSFYLLFPIGILGLLLLIAAVRSSREAVGTLLGFASAMLLWTGWAAYAFKFNEITLQLPMVPLGEGRRPMNLLFIQGSIGICSVALLYFVLDKDTRCNAFRWLQRHLRLGLGKPDPSQQRNVGRITFMETIMVLWFCYGVSLFLGDPRYLGYHHPVTYAIVAVLAVWGLYLFWRLLKFTRVMAGIRYAIPTKAILWIPFGEFLPRYGLYKEIWLEPWDYRWQIAGLLGAFVLLLLAAVLVPQRRVVAPRPGGEL